MLRKRSKDFPYFIRNMQNGYSVASERTLCNLLKENISIRYEVYRRFYVPPAFGGARYEEGITNDRVGGKGGQQRREKVYKHDG